MRSTRALWVLVLGTALVGVASAAADELKVSGVAKNLMVRCDWKHGHVSVGASRSTVTIVGDCGLVAILGSDNRVQVSSASTVAVTGARNYVSAPSTDGVLATGVGNTISYGMRRYENRRPKVGDVGKRNTLIAK